MALWSLSMPKNTPAKKNIVSRTVRKTSSRASYACPNPDRPYSLLEIVKKIVNDKEFARFIRRLLCKANKGDKEAQACVDSYFDVTDGELGKLCIPTQLRARYLQCTDQNRLIDAVAYHFGEQ
jgi:hypothetical protein